MGLYSGGLIIGRIFESEIWGAYFRKGLFFGGLIIGMLRYLIMTNYKVRTVEAPTELFLVITDKFVFIDS